MLLALWLWACGADPVPPLQDPDPRVRKDALYALGPDGVKAELDTLVALATSDPEPTVRRLALGLLGPSGDPQVVPLLLAALNDWEDTSSQLTAATGLGNVGHPAACPVLVDAYLTWPSERDPVWQTLRSSLIKTEPLCNDLLRERKPERPDRVGSVLLEISRRR